MTEFPSDLTERSRTLRHWSPLGDVAVAIEGAVASFELCVWVGRRGAEFRWSPATRGGPYPLLRMVARYLELDHYRLAVTGVEALDGWTIVEGDESPDAEAIVVVPGGASIGEIEQLLAGRLGQ